jgi:hypothetical protein
MILHGCREPFMPVIEDYENILVVDGLITDQEGPYAVKLSRSFPFDRKFPVPEPGAAVLVRDEFSGSFLFTEQSPGIYISDETFMGITGRRYQLVVSTTDGKAYESEWVMLRGVPVIDSVTWKFLEIPGPFPGQDRHGVQVSVSSHDPAGATRYYRWEWSETWEIITPIKSSLYLDEERCWKSVSSSQIAIGTTEHLVSDVVRDHPLYIISTADSRLRIRYSVLIRQYSMSRETYSYWKNLLDITRNTGSLFDPAPSQVTGNIYDRDEPGNPVLGIFQASAVTMQRIFIERSGLPAYLHIPGGFEGCRFITTADSAEILYYRKHGWEYVDEYVDGNTLFTIFTNSPVCFRCTLSGSNVRPGYWPVSR